MPRFASARRFALLAFSSSVAAGIGPACSLGLDASLMNTGASRGDSGVPSATQDEDGRVPPDAGGVRGAAPAAAGNSCATDADCTAAFASNACVTSSRCDPTWHVCTLEVCQVGACAVADCDLLGERCAAPAALDFTISVFNVVSGGVGGLAPASAVAAAYPFLFVLTTNGVVAYDVVNPTVNAPAMVAVQGLSFIPTALVASGRRVYFVSDVQGEGPSYRQAVAWIDVPGNPFLTSLTAQSAFIWTTQSSLAGAFADPSGGLALVYGASFAPTVTLAPPILDSTMLVPAPIAALTRDAAIVSASGAELVAYRYVAANHEPNLALVSSLAQSGGQATSEQTVASYGPLDNQASFAVGGGGTVLWESAPLHRADAGYDGVSSARLTWLVPSGDGGLFDTSAHADLETYAHAAPAVAVGPGAASGDNAPVVGPAVWSDANTAVALAATAEDTSATSIQVFDRASGAVVAGRRGVIPAPSWSLGIAASNGFAYVFSPADGSNKSAKVYVVAPGCPLGTGTSIDGGHAPPSDAGITLPDGGGGTHPHTGFTPL